MSGLLESLAAELDSLEARGLRRSLELPAGLDFSSNDYLGLGNDPAVRARLLARMADGELGAPASRLLRGHTRAHVILEQRLAALKGTQAALLFPSGYQANLAVLTTLVRPGDRVISDELNHASLIDGVRLSRATRMIVPHLDADAVADALAAPHPGRTFLVTESLFSMEGDIAPLDRYATLAEAAGADLIVDDAHGTGVFGDARGGGLVEEFGVADRVAAVVSTFGKAYGMAGACVAGPARVIDYLVNRARAFAFTTAVPPLLVAAIHAALDVAETQPERRTRVLALAARLRATLAEGGLGHPNRARGPIVPVILGDADRALDAAARMRSEGFDVRAVRPPTVPPGTSRLRLSVHADRREAEIDALAEALVRVATPVAPVP